MIPQGRLRCPSVHFPSMAPPERVRIPLGCCEGVGPEGPADEALLGRVSVPFHRCGNREKPELHTRTLPRPMAPMANPGSSPEWGALEKKKVVPPGRRGGHPPALNLLTPASEPGSLSQGATIHSNRVSKPSAEYRLPSQAARARPEAGLPVPSSAAEGVVAPGPDGTLCLLQLGSVTP